MLSRPFVEVAAADGHAVFDVGVQSRTVCVRRCLAVLLP